MSGRDGFALGVGVGAFISTVAGLLTRLILNHPIAFKEKS